tara:strand:- start:236 stop:793 length:558 start_codon:yes stop_codon:yes gene_type:complete
MDDFNLIEMGENYNTLRGVNLEPFKDPKQHKSKLLQELHYYSQLTMEFYIIATGAPKDMKLCLPYIKANMEQSLLRKRFAELKLITYELDDLVLGIDCSNKEQVYQAHHILRTTVNFILKILKLPLAKIPKRNSSRSKYGELVDDDIRCLVVILEDEALQNPIPEKLLPHLGLVIQNLNEVVIRV